MITVGPYPAYPAAREAALRYRALGYQVRVNHQPGRIDGPYSLTCKRIPANA